MHKSFFSGLIAITLGLSTPIFAEDDKDGSSDHPLITRYPGFYIDEYKARDFDRAQMIVSAMDDRKYELMNLEGQVSNIEYRIEDESISGFQLYANYKSALEKLDAEIIFTCFGMDECGSEGSEFYNESTKFPALFGGDRIDFFNEFGILTAIVNQDAQQAHVMIVTAANRNDRRRVFQTIVTTASLDDEKVGVGTIEDLTAAVTQTGTVVLDGVFFDTGTADLTDASNATLETVAAYLTANSDQQFFVVGHTDWVGAYDFNLGLSESRANAVVAALQSSGIDGGRLTGIGVGPTVPLANNATEEGRALNRRVALVLRE